MAIITVGSGMQYSTISAAVAASHSGDTIFVQAGTYTNDFALIKTDINLVGVGGMVHMVATNPVAKGMLTTMDGTTVTVDHFEFSGAKNIDSNGAGIRYQGGTLTVTNSYFHDNQDGLLGGGIHPAGNIIVDHSEFSHNGAGDGQSHNLYIAESHSLTVTNSFLHDAVVGHELKSRAEITTVLNNRIADFNGTGSYDIDLGKGGVATIKGNYIQQGPNSQNPAIINYGGNLFTPWANSQLTVEDNIIVNQLANRPIGVMNRIATVTAQIHNNHFFGLTPAQIANGLNAQSGNDTLAQAPAPDMSHPWAANAWDKIIWQSGAVNTLIGTSGHDLFAGGSGSDTFVISKGGNSDTIAGFDSPGGHDVIQLQGYGFNSFAGVQGAMSQHGADVVLNLGNGETLTILGTTVGNFTAADFTFSNAQLPQLPQPPQPPPPPPQQPTTTTTQPPPTHATVFQLASSASPAGYVTGTAGNDVLNGTSKSELIYGGTGSDTMSGGAGDDTYNVDAKDLVIENANAGIDTVVTTLASYTLTANVENLVLKGAAQIGIGNALNNIISATSGNDTMDGGAGNDILMAGSGSYRLTGGTGNDIFTFTSNAGGTSTITDYHQGEDLIDFRTIFKAAGYSGTDPLADHAIQLASDGHGGTLISIDPTHSGMAHPIVDVFATSSSALSIGLDVLWH